MDGCIRLWSDFPLNTFDKAGPSLSHFYRDLPHISSHMLTKIQSLNLSYPSTDHLPTSLPSSISILRSYSFSYALYVSMDGLET